MADDPKNFRVNINPGITLAPKQIDGNPARISIDDTITWRSNLTDDVCQAINFYPEHCIAPQTLVVEPDGTASAIVIAMPPDQITYWCTPAGIQEMQGTADQYDPAQGIIIVDPPIPEPDKGKSRKSDYEPVIG